MLCSERQATGRYLVASALTWEKGRMSRISRTLWLSCQRPIWWASLMFAVLAASVGCTPTSPTEDTPLTLVFKHPRLLSREEPLRLLLDEFRQAHPEIRLREEILPSSSDQQHLFYVTNLEAEAADFDVFALDIIWVPEFRRAGWLHDVTAHFTREDVEDFLPMSLAAAQFDARLYAIPWFADAGVLYYRADLLERYGFSPPRTISELVTTAQAIVSYERHPSLNGFVWQGKQYEGLLCVALEFIRAYGGEILNDQGQSLLTSSATATGLQALRKTVGDYGISPSWVTTADEETARHVFARGDAVFMRNWPYAWSLLNAADSPVHGRVGVTGVPGSIDYAGVPTLGGWHLGINRFSRHPYEAGQLLTFLTSTSAQRRLALAGGLKPTRVSVYEDVARQRGDPALALFLPFLRAARPRPVTPFYLMLSQVLQGEVSAAVTGIKPVALALQDAERQVQQILALEVQEHVYAEPPP